MVDDIAVCTIRQRESFDCLRQRADWSTDEFDCAMTSLAEKLRRASHHS
jgi:hypothetical protein